MLKLNGKEYVVWTSVKGGAFTGDCTAHLTAHGDTRTLCGRLRGRMTLRWNQFDVKRDCKRCARKVAA